MCTSNSTPQLRQCVICNKHLLGRRDKVFCDIKCKNYFHSEVRRTTRSITSETIRILKRNYVILEGFMTEKADRFTVHKVKLEKEGFKFHYATQISHYQNNITFSLFNFDYLILRNNLVVVKRVAENTSISPFLFKRWLMDVPELMAS